ncbi:hypothetical protein E3P98_00601 [Wallemia ichthyophaga]|nr:hypothetical protein E3P98_00601 [Wallemia ichthyophaga]
MEEILNRISNQSDSILSLKRNPGHSSYPVKAALGDIDILDYLRDGEESEVRLFGGGDDDKANDKNLLTLNPTNHNKLDNEMDIDINTLLDAAIKIINDYKQLPRTINHINNLKVLVEETNTGINKYQRVIQSPLDSNLDTDEFKSDIETPNDSNTEELIKVQSTHVRNLESHLSAIKDRKDFLQSSLNEKKSQFHSHSHNKQPPTPIQLPLRQLKDIQRRNNTPRKPKLATVRREQDLFKSIPKDDDSFNLGGEETLNTSTLLGNTPQMNLVPSTPIPDGAAAANDDILSQMDTPIETKNVPTITNRSTIPTTTKHSTTPTDTPADTTKHEKSNTQTPTHTPKHKSQTPTPAPPPTQQTQHIELTPEVEAAINLIWDGFGEAIRTPSTNRGKPDLAQMLHMLQVTVDSVPAAHVDGSNPSNSPTHSLLSITSSLTKETNSLSPQTAASAALLLKLLITPANRLPMQDAKDHLAHLVNQRGWPAELTTKSIYALVGKRLLQLDRKGASATLRFRI